MRCVVYTAIVGDYDRIYAPAAIEPDIDYVAITGPSDPRPPAPWQHQSPLHYDRNPRMTSRWHKMHPHVLFPDHDVSLYVDGNVYLKGNARPLVEQMSGAASIALFRHPDRDFAYEEAEVIKRYRLDDAAIVDTQMAYYRMLGYPMKLGLFNGSILIRRHHDGKLVNFLEDWWRQIKAFSHRDQLSLNFMLLRHGIEAGIIPGTLNDNPWFATGPHKRHKVDLANNNCMDHCDEIDWLRRSMIASEERQARDKAPKVFAKSLSWQAIELLRNVKRQVNRLTWRVPHPQKPTVKNLD